MLGEQVFDGLIGSQLTLVLLAAPALTAGSVCHDKTRGLMAHLLMTDLTSTEIVLGKLSHRLIPALGLVFLSLPVLALSTFLGGISPAALFGAYLVTLGACLVSCTLALTLSIWATRTQEALMVVYFAWIVVVLAYPLAQALGGWWSVSWPYMASSCLLYLNPYCVAFLPCGPSGRDGLRTQALFLFVALCLSAFGTILSIVRIRTVVLHHSRRAEPQHRQARWRVSRSAGRRFVGPSLAQNPVLWREWHFARGSAWGRMIWGFYLAAASLASVCSLMAMGESIVPDKFTGAVAGVIVVVGLLFLCLGSVTRLADERVQGTLDLLLATPLSSHAILKGKWWGSFRLTLVIAIWPTLLVLAFAWHYTSPFASLHARAGIRALALTPVLILSYGAFITSLGLCLAVCIQRIGYAMASCIAAYTAVSLVWPFVTCAIRPFDYGRVLAAASPFVGVIYPVLYFEVDYMPSGLIVNVSWTGINFLVAYLLWRIGKRSFEARTGRMSIRRSRPTKLTTSG